jgi:hypothetical protein
MGAVAWGLRRRRRGRALRACDRINRSIRCRPHDRPTGGGGIENALGNRLSLKAEYLYMSLKGYIHTMLPNARQQSCRGFLRHTHYRDSEGPCCARGHQLFVWRPGRQMSAASARMKSSGRARAGEGQQVSAPSREASQIGCPLACRYALRLPQCLLRVKSGKGRTEQIESALPSTADVSEQGSGVSSGLLVQQTTWQCTTLIRVKFSCSSPEEGTAIGDGKKCLFVIIPQRPARSR